MEMTLSIRPKMNRNNGNVFLTCRNGLRIQEDVTDELMSVEEYTAEFGM